MTYKEFKKQAFDFGFSNKNPYEFPTYSRDMSTDTAKNNPSMAGQWNTDAETRKWNGYSVDNPYDKKFETERTNLYKPGMTSQEKWDTWQKQVKDTASDNVGWFRGAMAKGQDFGNKIFGGGDQNASNFDKLKDEAIGGENVQRETDKFLHSLTPEDVAYYQRNKERLMGGENPLNTNLQGYKSFNKYVQNGMASRMWNAVQQDTFKYLPMAIGTFLRQAGLPGGLAAIAENPLAFYGTLGSALFLGGASMLRGNQNITVNNNSAQSQHAGYSKIPYS